MTGGAGFIGSHLAEAIPGARVLDDLSTGRRANLPAGAEFVEGDVCDPAAVRRALEGVDVVHHLAAIPSVPRSLREPEAVTRANVLGTQTVLAEAARAGVRRVVYASSSSVYGDSATLPKREDFAPEPLSPYAASKLAGEIACVAAARSLGVETVCLRFFNVYGPRQDPDSPYAAVIPIFLSRLRRGEPLPVHGDGGQTRDFTYVSDVARGMMAAAEATGVSGRVFNLAGGRPVAIRQVAETAGRVLGLRPVLEFGPPRAGDVRHSYGDGALAERLLGFRPQVPLEEGLRRTAQWLGP